MNAAVLTFPGHFFQTALCLQSLCEHYPECRDHVTVIADDVDGAAWPGYVQDLAQLLGQDLIVNIRAGSTLPGIRDCVSGWWRQQLIKLTLHDILPGQQWFVVDGDVIFRSRCDIQHSVPVSRWHQPGRWSTMCESYVRGMLGIDQGCLYDQHTKLATSPIPFRYLDRDLLAGLISHVESLHGHDFVSLHLAWFQDQTIVADWDPPTRWVMSEWELIECFRRFVQGQELPYHDIGSGYQPDDVGARHAGATAHGIFIHSYQRDVPMGRQWFQRQGLHIDPTVWQHAEHWYRSTEVRS